MKNVQQDRKEKLPQKQVAGFLVKQVGNLKKIIEVQQPFEEKRTNTFIA